MKIKLLESQSPINELERSNQIIDFLVGVLSSVAEYRDLESEAHVKRIKHYTNELITTITKLYPEYGLTEIDKDYIVKASALHDIGKIAIPDEILMKPGKLTGAEFEIMKNHTIYACDILNKFANKNDVFYKYCYDICRYHHERWDGRGYPDKLKGERIPIWAQIVGIADVYDALVNKKIYKDAITKDKAIEMIINGDCGIFNPKIIEAFKKSSQAF